MAMDPPPPPAKKRRPMVPVFANGSNGSTSGVTPSRSDEEESKATLQTGSPAPVATNGRTNGAVAAAVPSTEARKKPELAAGAAGHSEDLPTKVGQAEPDQRPHAPVAAQQEAPPAHQSPAATPPVTGVERQAQRKVSRPATEQLPPAAVYGFDGGMKAESRGKAIALRLEPLKSGLPEYEKVLGEQKQTVSIGCNRGKVDVAVRDEAVSKKHVSLSIVGIHGELALSVMDHSTNGSFLNGHRLPEKNKRYRIRNGDKLTLKAPDIEEDYGWKVDFGNTVAYFTRA
ncbi:unnamed protein product [Durusdinium trenchii]|uniref:FHA domain-containing protein n=2 Tax=Durusdinium trenchii TaxID=1381693 RepID=A0ABP0HKF0_9DINO